MTNEELFAMRNLALREASEYVGKLAEIHPLPETGTESKGLFNTSATTTSLKVRVTTDLQVADWLLDGLDLEVERLALFEPGQGTLRDLIEQDDEDDELP